MSHKPIPIGTEYGFLRIDSEPIVEKSKPIYYWFICKCGTRKKISIQHIKSGAVVSCGCKYRKTYHCRRCHTEDQSKFSGRMKGLCRSCKRILDKLRINSSPELKRKRLERITRNQQKSILNFITRQIGRARKNAEKKSRKFDITVQQVIELWEKQNGICALSGLAMSHKYNDLRSVSIDRIDSDKQYTIDNIQLVCKMLNLGKSKHTNDEMKEFIKDLRAN